MPTKKTTNDPVANFVLSREKKAPGGLIFPPDGILKNTNLTIVQKELNLAEHLLASEEDPGITARTFFSPRKELSLQAEGNFSRIHVSITINRTSITDLSCDCGRSRLYSYWFPTPSQSGVICGHALAMWMSLRKYIIENDPGDETSYEGHQFLSLLTENAVPSDPTPLKPTPEKEAVVELLPRITRDKKNESLNLSFDIGRSGERLYLLKSLENLVKASETGLDFSVSKNTVLNFSRETFTPDSEKWYRLVLSRIRSVNSVNSRLSPSRYYYYSSSSSLSVGSGIPLEESDLDIVYDLAQGGTLLYQYGTRSEACSVRVGDAYPKIEISLNPILANRRLIGINVSGIMPRLLRGSLHQYILDRNCFGRVTEDNLSIFKSLQSIGSEDGTFQCSIGKSKFAEFYYRVLPLLQDNPQVLILDNVGKQLEELLPPEAQFTFFLDRSDKLSCRILASYGDLAFDLCAPEAPALAKRDFDQENRVLSMIRQFFPEAAPSGSPHYCPADDQHIAWILTEGIALLSRYGEVKGSNAFSQLRIKPIPSSRFSVQIDGGLLDLSIKTKDLTEDELLELLTSYRLKKRWHRLKSGDFVDLRDTSPLDELTNAAAAMDVSLEDLVAGNVKLPKYRALYVDRLLEEHEGIVNSRDRHFKSLIRSFQTIRDSDFEAPESLVETLRPYQLYGFRWMSTLSQAGFGGILADEMGLGKTLQTLAYIAAQKKAGEEKPALVVCPASLVYNWKDESSKFTPELSVETIAGTVPQRKEILKNPDKDLYVTSYDLLKRDITLYDGITFSATILDEAQFIKNQKSAVAKAVKVLKSDHRFALTGTPIENRLSELWSIFDYLMPGFLYSPSEFSSRFESPIMKHKDQEASAKLTKMTGPFVLRRKKTDVLKDLPEKLEETRRAEMETAQRRLYDAQLVRMKSLLASSSDSGEDKMRILAEITRLRQICCDPSLLFADYKGSSAKRSLCLDLIQSSMDAGHRLLVFSQFTSMLALLEEDLKKEKIPYFLLTGSTNKQERLRLVNAFNKGDSPVFLISLKAGGTGLNLTGADVVIHYDPWWNLAVQNQATDRAHRIGQKKQVTVIKLIAADTIEEKIAQLQETKRELADTIINGQNTSLMSLSRNELMELFV
ncbi:MAG: DEAD/DEAH box helicase [Lachnospiraceae bacterium]|nr:DEAD/DEAH box helicase [Lachnospiraceae bacterium]